MFGSFLPPSFMCFNIDLFYFKKLHVCGDWDGKRCKAGWIDMPEIPPTKGLREEGLDLRLAWATDQDAASKSKSVNK
jgi:hypothetical protein